MTSIANDHSLTFEERKKILKNEGKKIQDELNLNIQDLKQDALHYGKYVAAVGGAFLVAYMVSNAIFGRKKKKEEPKIIYLQGDGEKTVMAVKEETVNPIVKMILSAIATFILSLLKQRLMQVLEEIKNNEFKNSPQTS